MRIGLALRTFVASVRGCRIRLLISADYTDYADFGSGQSRTRTQKGPTSNSAPLGLDPRRKRNQPFKALHSRNIPFGNRTPSSETRRPLTRGRAPLSHTADVRLKTEICVICGYFTSLRPLRSFAAIKVFLHPPDSVPASNPLLVPIFSRSFASIRGLFGVSPICVNLRLSAVWVLFS
jgi:hypothetical protein